MRKSNAPSTLLKILLSAVVICQGAEHVEGEDTQLGTWRVCPTCVLSIDKACVEHCSYHLLQIEGVTLSDSPPLPMQFPL